MEKITYYIKKKIGRDYHSFSVDGKNLHEAVMAAKKLSFQDVPCCGICKSDDLELSAHVTPKEGHEYTYVRCKACKATLNFGQQKKDDDVFYLRTVTIEGGPYAGQKAFEWKPFDKTQTNN